MLIEVDHIVYRNAKVKDALQLSVLFKQVYIHTYALEGVSLEFSKFIEEKFAPERIEEIITQDPERLAVALYNDNPVGVAEVGFNRRCPIGDMVGPELSKLYILERFSGKGIGYNLLNRAEVLVQGRGHKELWLWVYAINDRAIGFYERQGYSSIGTAYFQMEVNRYENRVMMKTFE